VYCPSCGSENQAGVKFCTRCGVNLAVVSDALAGRSPTATVPDERMVKLLKDYYRSRPMTLIGAAAGALSLFKLAGVFLLGFPEKMIPIAILAVGFFLLSLYAFIWGLIRWNNSSSEMRALGTSPSKLQLLIGTGGTLASADRPVESECSTNPLNLRGSVTEQTTHLLEEAAVRQEDQAEHKQ